MRLQDTCGHSISLSERIKDIAVSLAVIVCLRACAAKEQINRAIEVQKEFKEEKDES
jgi:hypothetical protein